MMVYKNVLSTVVAACVPPPARNMRKGNLDFCLESALESVRYWPAPFLMAKASAE